MKNKTSIKVFEDFFTSEYKDEVLRIFELYPDEKDLKIDYNKLEIFDPDLADLLIYKPEEVITAAQIAMNNIDPLIKNVDINIKVDNLTNIIPFSKLTSDYVGQFVSFECIVQDIKKPSPELKIGVFECRGCMKLHEVDQFLGGAIISPSLCGECGGRSFRLLQEESEYRDTQVIQVTDMDTQRSLQVLLEGSDCSYDDYFIHEKLQITGVLKTFKRDDKFEYYIDSNYVVQLPDSSVHEEIIEVENRNSPEYNEWVKGVINRDKVCQCCGGEKHLEAHHIFGYKKNPDYRINPENGIALCKWCHGKYHSYHGLANANPQSLIKFIRRFGKD